MGDYIEGSPQSKYYDEIRKLREYVFCCRYANERTPTLPFLCSSERRTRRVNTRRRRLMKTAQFDKKICSDIACASRKMYPPTTQRFCRPCYKQNNFFARGQRSPTKFGLPKWHYLNEREIRHWNGRFHFMAVIASTLFTSHITNIIVRIDIFVTLSVLIVLYIKIHI